MVKKSRNSVKISKEVTPPLENKTDEPIGILATTKTPQTGSPTTGNSGLVSAKRTLKRSKTPRQKAVNTNSNNTTTTNTELRISEKRKMVTGLSRSIMKQVPITEKILKFFAINNVLVNPKTQKLLYAIALDDNNTTYFSISLKVDNRSKVSDSITEFRKVFKGIKTIDQGDINNPNWLKLQFIIDSSPNKKSSSKR